MIRSIASTSPSGLRVNLYAPWLVPIATAKASLGLVGIGEQLVVRKGPLGAVPVFLLANSGFQRAETAQFPFDGNAAAMGHLDHVARNARVVRVIGRRLAVILERAVHHHARKAVFDGALARGGAVAVILVHGNRNLRIKLGGGEHQMPQVVVLRIAPRPARGLHDHGRIGLGGGGEDRLNLLHVVDVERGQAVIILGGVIEQKAQGNQWHDGTLQIMKQ